MTTLTYPSGEDVREGDCVRYLGEVGSIEFLALERAADAATDWYAEQFPGGGVMILAESFGRVFLSPVDFEGHLEFIARRE